MASRKDGKRHRHGRGSKLFTSFYCVLKKGALWQFPLLGGFGKQF